MSLTPRLALDLARARQSGWKRAALVSQSTPATAKAGTTPVRMIAGVPPRIDRVLFIEGQRAAKELLGGMVEILTSRQNAAEVLGRLRQIAAANPISYAAGVLDVVVKVEQMLPATTEQLDLKEQQA